MPISHEIFCFIPHLLTSQKQHFHCSKNYLPHTKKGKHRAVIFTGQSNTNLNAITFASPPSKKVIKYTGTQLHFGLDLWSCSFYLPRLLLYLLRPNCNLHCIFPAMLTTCFLLFSPCSASFTIHSPHCMTNQTFSPVTTSKPHKYLLLQAVYSMWSPKNCQEWGLPLTLSCSST